MHRNRMIGIIRTVVLSVFAVVAFSAVRPGSNGTVAAQKKGGGGTNEPITPPNTTQPVGLNPLDSPESPEFTPETELRARMVQQRIKQANESRVERLHEDADKLLQLATDLKANVEKDGRDELSPDNLRRTQEIEKLAHDVQSRMKN